MSKRPLLTIFFASLTFMITMVIGIANNQHVQASLFNRTFVAVSGNTLQGNVRIDPEAYSFDPGEIYTLGENVRLGKYGTWSWCKAETPKEPTYDVDLISVDQDASIQGGDLFTVTMTLKNMGDRIYSANSECFEKPTFKIGTALSSDRESLFGSADHAISGWESPARLNMIEKYADYEDEFTVVFQSLAPEGDNIYREYFQPVLEGIEWLDEPFAFDIEVGNPTDTMRDNIQYVIDTALDAASLEGLEKNLEMNLSEQRMLAKFGDITVWSMPTSSGKYDTPTPAGTYTIFQKQELRRGGEWPHYMMPYWMYWDNRGYGIHGLPYLNSDGGAFWSEAESNIGRPVSHGCIRTLPKDAQTLYAFTPIGTQLVVHH
jgi:hypothetical protein